VLFLLSTLAFLTYLDRICIMRVQGDIERDLRFDELTAADWDELRRDRQEDDRNAIAAKANARATERMGWVFAAFLWGYVLFEIPGGWLGDRRGPRRVIIAIVIWWSLFTALTGSVDQVVGLFVESPEPALLLGALVLVRFLFGLGEAPAYPNIARALARWFPFRDRGAAQGVIWMSSRLGGALAPAAIGALVRLPGEWGGWRHAFWILGGVGIAWAVLFSAVFRDRPEEDARSNEAERTLIRSTAAHSGSIYDDRRIERVPWRRLLFSSNLLAIYLTAASVSFSWYFCVTFLPKYLKDEFHVDYSSSEWMSGLPLLCGGLACLAGGRISDALIRRTGSKRWGRSLPGVVGFAGAGLCALLVSLAPNAWTAIALLCAANVFQDIAIPCIWSLPADVGGRYSGTLGGAMNSAGGIGGALSPLVAAQVATAFGWSWLFLVFAGSYLLGAILWLRIDASEVLVAPEPDSPVVMSDERT
jgi:MFS family permease